MLVAVVMLLLELRSGGMRSELEPSDVGINTN
jgi:hypothetical protein